MIIKKPIGKFKNLCLTINSRKINAIINLYTQLTYYAQDTY